MKYELLFQPTQPGEPYDPAKLEALLEPQSSTRGDGTRLWRLPHGEVEVRPLLEGGRAIATEAKVPLLASLDLIREVVQNGTELAKGAGCTLFDPQLMRAVTPHDEGAVADHYLRTARYAGEMAGVSEAIGIGQPPPDEGLKPGTKVFLGITAFFVLLYLIANKLLG